MIITALPEPWRVSVTGILPNPPPLWREVSAPGAALVISSLVCRQKFSFDFVADQPAYDSGQRACSDYGRTATPRLTTHGYGVGFQISWAPASGVAGAWYSSRAGFVVGLTVGGVGWSPLAWTSLGFFVSLLQSLQSRCS